MAAFKNIIKNNIYMVLTVLLVIAAGALYMALNRKPALHLDPVETILAPTNEDSKPTLAATPTQHEERTITVYITGAVVNPGVYVIAEDAHVIDLLRMAGGESGDADLERINLAAYMRDAQHVKIPAFGDPDPEPDPYNYQEADASRGGPPGADAGAGSAVVGDGKININTASLSALTTLPGIGPVIAGNIVEYREKYGGFRTIEEIKQVSRIGEATFGNIKDLIKVE